MSEQRGKYNAHRTTIDGITFASAAEARRYDELKLMEMEGEIGRLELQPHYPLVVNGQRVAVYIGDFLYVDSRSKQKVLEDVKGVKTPVYRLKKKLMMALYGIDIVEVIA